MPKEKLISTVSTERRTAYSLCFRTFIALKISRVVLIAPIDSTRTDIYTPRLPHNFCSLDHFIIIGVCVGISYHGFYIEDCG